VQAELTSQAEFPRDHMRIAVPGKEDALEKDKACRPDGGRAPKPGKELLSNNEFHLKEEKGAQENSRREGGLHTVAGKKGLISLCFGHSGRPEV
jgi:hypothetical protein